MAAGCSRRKTVNRCPQGAAERTREPPRQSRSTGRSESARSTILSSEKTRRPKREGKEEDAECHRRRPRRPVEGGGEALDDAEQHRGDHRPGKAAEPAEHANGEDAADIFASDRGLDRLDDDQQRAGG